MGGAVCWQFKKLHSGPCGLSFRPIWLYIGLCTACRQTFYKMNHDSKNTGHNLPGILLYICCTVVASGLLKCLLLVCVPLFHRMSLLNLMKQTSISIGWGGDCWHHTAHDSPYKEDGGIIFSAMLRWITICSVQVLDLYNRNTLNVFYAFCLINASECWKNKNVILKCQFLMYGSADILLQKMWQPYFKSRLFCKHSHCKNKPLDFWMLHSLVNQRRVRGV